MTRFKPVGPKDSKRFRPRRRAVADRSGKLASRLRSTQQWRDLRQKKLAMNPICEWCRERPAEEVHHVRHVAEYPELVYDLSNLQSLCAKCHHLVEGARSRGIDLDTIKAETAMRHGRELNDEVHHGRQPQQRPASDADGIAPSARQPLGEKPEQRTGED